jgi:RNA polymerase sigma factor (sigma-70 family)
MRRIECAPRGEVPFRALSLQSDQALAGFEELAMPLSHSLYNFARWLAHNQHDAEDLVQETYLKALHNFASFEPGTNFRAWIFKILKNTFLTSRSKQEHRTIIPMDIEENSWVLPATSDTPESLLIEHFDIDAVRTAIEQLSATHREVILLCDVEDASYREIAEILSIPIGTVMSRLARARKALCELLGRAHCAPLASGLAHPIEMHERDARVAEAAKRTAGYERRVHRSELPRGRAQASA